MSERESTGGAGLAGEGTSTEGRSTWSRRQGKGHCLGAKEWSGECLPKRSGRKERAGGAS